MRQLLCSKIDVCKLSLFGRHTDYLMVVVSPIHPPIVTELPFFQTEEEEVFVFRNVSRVSSDQLVSLFCYARIYTLCTLQLVDGSKVSTFVQCTFVAPVGAGCIHLCDQDIRITLVGV